MGNEPLVYRLRSGRSNHYAIASVELLLLSRVGLDIDEYNHQSFDIFCQ